MFTHIWFIFLVKVGKYIYKYRQIYHTNGLNGLQYDRRIFVDDYRGMSYDVRDRKSLVVDEMCSHLVVSPTFITPAASKGITI